MDTSPIFCITKHRGGGWYFLFYSLAFFAASRNYPIFSPAASRSIAGCGVSHIGEVAHIVMEGLKMSRTDLLPSKFQIDPEHEIDALCRHTVKNIVFPVQHIVGKSVKRKPRSESIRGFQVNEMYIGELSEI